MEKRENWGSRFGFIMAAAGSAVGLGNIWRFPYLTGKNGGGAFLLIYLIFAVVVGLSIMLAEFTMGRYSGRAAVGSYKFVGRQWTFVGVIGVLTAFLIMGFYPVVGGWAVAYVVKSFTGLITHPAAISDAFGAFISSPVEPLIWMLIFLAMNVLIVAKGISSGIETAGKVLMPTLLGILVIISIKSISLPGSMAGLKFLFVPDWSAVDANTALAALGQAFFSLSLGMGCMITYGSYLGKKEHLPSNALMVTLTDTLCAILAGVAIFPALFAYNMEPTAGPGLVFVVVPSIFSEFGSILGPLFSALFFVALTVAALTSSVSLLEVSSAYFIDERGWNRKKAVGVSAVGMLVCCLLASLSLGAMSGVKILGVGFFDLFDLLTDKVYLALGGLLLCVVVGWFVNKEDLKKEIENNGGAPFALFEVWYFLVKYIIPIAIAIVAITGILAAPQKGVMILGVASIVILGIFSKKL